MPDLTSIPEYSRKDIEFRLEVPFCDREYFSPFNGLRNIEHAAADWEETVTLRNGQIVSKANTGDEFEIDEEGAELFWEFELEHALNRISLDKTPSAAIHYWVGLGTLTIFKGGLGEWDRMLRVSNQIHRHGLQPFLSKPKALLARLADIGLISADSYPDLANEPEPAFSQSEVDYRGEFQLSLFV